MRLVLTVVAPAAVHAAHPMGGRALRTPSVVLGIASQIIVAVLNIARVQASVCTMVRFLMMLHLLLIVMIQAVGGFAALELGRAVVAVQMVALALVRGVVLIQIILVPWVLVVQAVWIVIALS